jgi:hypothetical protein
VDTFIFLRTINILFPATILNKLVSCPDSFCLTCGWLIFNFHGGNFAPLTKKAYKLYFGCNVGDQDKTWAPHLCCVYDFWQAGWIGSVQCLFIIPMMWKQLKDHSADWYFCLTNMLNSTVKSKHMVEYPNL